MFPRWTHASAEKHRLAQLDHSFLGLKMPAMCGNYDAVVDGDANNDDGAPHAEEPLVAGFEAYHTPSEAELSYHHAIRRSSPLV
jgi:hypothetical protein